MKKRWRCNTPLLCVGLALALATQQPACAQRTAAAPIDDEVISIEAPSVQRILRRAARLDGPGGKRGDFETAANLYCLAARLGSVEAHYRLGLMILDGRGMKQDDAGAATLFGIAAGNGHAAASAALERLGVQRLAPPDCLTLQNAASLQAPNGR